MQMLKLIKNIHFRLWWFLTPRIFKKQQAIGYERSYCYGTQVPVINSEPFEYSPTMCDMALYPLLHDTQVKSSEITNQTYVLICCSTCWFTLSWCEHYWVTSLPTFHGCCSYLCALLSTLAVNYMGILVLLTILHSHEVAAFKILYCLQILWFIHITKLH
jgi:hypothetical protein